MPLSLDTDSLLSTRSGFHSGSMRLPSQSDPGKYVEQPLLDTAQVNHLLLTGLVLDFSLLFGIVGKEKVHQLDKQKIKRVI